MQRTVAIDFDGVMNTYIGWRGEDELFEPRPGLKEFLESLAKHGFEVVVHSSRRPEKIRRWLEAHGLSHLVARVSETKPPAVCYLDDRAVRFDGNFGDAFLQIVTFKAHWES